jgi:hypothetical protein
LTVELAGGTQRWNGGTVERWNACDHRADRGSSQSLWSLFFVSLVVVFARFRAFLRVVIPNEFQLDSARIGLEQIKKTTRENARKPANIFLGLIRGHPPHPR